MRSNTLNPSCEATWVGLLPKKQKEVMMFGLFIKLAQLSSMRIIGRSSFTVATKRLISIIRERLNGVRDRSSSFKDRYHKVDFGDNIPVDLAVGEAKFFIMLSLLKDAGVEPSNVGLPTLLDDGHISDSQYEWFTYLSSLNDEDFYDIVTLFLSFVPFGKKYGRLIVTILKTGGQFNSVDAEQGKATNLEFVKNRLDALVVSGKVGGKPFYTTLPYDNFFQAGHQIVSLTIAGLSYLLTEHAKSLGHSVDKQISQAIEHINKYDNGKVGVNQYSEFGIKNQSNNCSIHDLEETTDFKKKDAILNCLGLNASNAFGARLQNGKESWLEFHSDFKTFKYITCFFDGELHPLLVVLRRCVSMHYQLVSDPVYTAFLADCPEDFERTSAYSFLTAHLNSLIAEYLISSFETINYKLAIIDRLVDFFPEQNIINKFNSTSLLVQRTVQSISSGDGSYYPLNNDNDDNVSTTDASSSPLFDSVFGR
jgi:hypothetical protein